jgi:RNA polymerase sigma factor (sigma-70 family)
MSQLPKPLAEGSNPPPFAQLLGELDDLIERLYRVSRADAMGLTRAQFQVTLERSAAKNFPQNSTASSLPPERLATYLENLHLEDLALATGCMEDCAGAWDRFVAAYRGHLRTTASALLRCAPGAPAACELADSLFADLYGLAAGERRERSLFRYFHGRSSLKTWLRAVLAQRHVDSIRAGRRFTDLEASGGAVDGNAAVSFENAPQRSQNSPSADPHRSHYLAAFARALDVAIAALDSRDARRLRLYYAGEQTLAEVGRELGEHESSVSRNLERTRRELRSTVTEALRGTPARSEYGKRPMNDDEISLCFEYAAEDAPIDLRTLLAEPGDAQTKGKEEA